MPIGTRKILISILTVIAFGATVEAQPSIYNGKFGVSGQEAENLLSVQELETSVSFLADTLCGGRASGSAGAVEAASWIVRQFSDAGLIPMGNNYLQSFVQNYGRKSMVATSPELPYPVAEAQSDDPASYSLAVPVIRHYWTRTSLVQQVRGVVSGENKIKKPPYYVLLPRNARNANAWASLPPAPAHVDAVRYRDTLTEVDRICCHNIIGFIPGYSDRYVIIAAHYDNLGVLGGRMYPGADSNGSGVASMLSIARMFTQMNRFGKTYSKNIIFVALDAKQYSMAGSNRLWRSISYGELRNPVTGSIITPSKISMFVNLDILGSSASPLHEGRTDYLIMLSSEKDKFQGAFRDCNRIYNYYMDLAFDYYGSKGFTNMFLARVSDQKVFIENGIPSVMFTSGITMQTNKVNDTPELIDFSILNKRTGLIFRWLDRVIPEL